MDRKALILEKNSEIAGQLLRADRLLDMCKYDCVEEHYRSLDVQVNKLKKVLEELVINTGLIVHELDQQRRKDDE